MMKLKKLVKLVILLLVLGLAAPAAATVTVTGTTTSASCDGSTAAFPFTFPIISTSDLAVILRTTATGDEEVLTETTDYSVSAVNNDYSSGGTVTTVQTYSSAYTLTILRDIPDTQNATLSESDTSVLRIAALEDALDKQTMLIQQLQAELDRCLKLPRTEASVSTELDDSVSRASKYLSFDSSGNPAASTTISSGSITVSSFMQTVLDDTDASTAKTTLTIPTITSFIETVLDDSSASEARTTLGAVGLTGDQTIAGAKTFSGAATFSAAATLADSSQLASSAAPTDAADIANKKYVDDSGAPYARMYQTAAQDNLTDTVWTVVTLDTDDFDSGTITDTANYKITPGVAGRYLVIGQVTYSNVIADKLYYAQIYKNGTAPVTTASLHSSAITSDMAVSVTDVVSLAADDYIQLRCNVDAGASTVDINIGTETTYLVLYRL